MTDNELLIIVASALSALVHLALNPLQLWLFPSRRTVGPFVHVFIYFPLGAALIYGVLYIAYRLYLNSYP